MAATERLNGIAVRTKAVAAPPGGEAAGVHGRLFRKSLLGWYLYEFGASAFATSVITVFMGPHLALLAHASADESGMLHLLGISLPPGSVYPYAISFSVILQILILPLIGAVADRLRRKKLMIGTFALLGSAALLAVGLEVSYLQAALLFVVANVCLGAAHLVYNSLLPELSPPDERNAVSSTGWGTGYLAGGLFLLGQYLFLEYASGDRSPLEATRICIVSSGFWWGGFTLLHLILLRLPPQVATPGAWGLSGGVRQLLATARDARRFPMTVLFLVAFLFYSDGIQTITAVSTQFGQEELKLGAEELARVILLVQFCGVLGAVLFNALSRWIGTKHTLLLTLLVYTGVTVYVYRFLTSTAEFYVLAAVIALVLVGSQALSRAAFSTMVPRGREAAYFGLYEVSERGTSWLGPLTFGLALQFTGSYRLAVLALAVFFLGGLLLLWRVDFRRAAREALSGGRA